VNHRTVPARRPDPEHNRPKTPPPPPPPSWRHWLIWIGLAISLGLFFLPYKTTPTPVSLNYTQFLKDVTGNTVKSATIDANGGITGKLTGGKSYTSQIPTGLADTSLAPLLEAHNVTITGKSPASSTLGLLLWDVLPFLLFLGIFLWLGRRAGRQMAAGLGSLTGSKAKLYDATKPSIGFAEVAGYEGAKQEVSEVVDFLKHPDRYTKIGAVGPKGVLMVGPPGTGKTLLARAVAGEAGVPFFSVTGSSFVEIFVGVGASRMRDLFTEARKRAPSIIFIDEIDAIGQRRGGTLTTNDEREQTLNQMLSEMDGFDPSTGVVVMAATNRPEVLDKALLRPGRFDRQVEIPLPNQKDRVAILRLHAASMKLAADIDFEDVARGTPGFSGADLANLVNEAAIVAVRDGRDEITRDDCFTARDRIMLGRRDMTNALLLNEKQSVAVHEAGHALVAALSPNSDPVSKVTILPAGHALGVTQQLPVDERHLYSETYLSESLAIRMGGRAAELLVLGETSTGASNDLAGATQLALRMVREFGMSTRLGPVGFASEDPAYLGDQPLSSRQYSEATQRVIDEEVERLLKEAEERARTILADHRGELDELVALLLEKETVDGAEVLAIAAGAVPRKAAEQDPLSRATRDQS
jgi:cell division protease FtsH